jgi:hypothetical protein
MEVFWRNLVKSAIFIFTGLFFSILSTQTILAIETAIGEIPTEPKEFVEKVFQWALGIAGGVAFLLIIFGGIRILTSTGDPETAAQGREIITSAIIGLVFIIFAVFILRVIGFDILRLPGFAPISGPP